MRGPENDLGGLQPHPLTYTRAQLCHVLDCSEVTLRRILPDLERRGFPGKIPGVNKWSRAAVADWIAHNGGDYTPYSERVPEVTGAIAAIAVDLERDYGGAGSAAALQVA